MENSVNKKNIIISKTSKKFYALLDCNISINENELNIIMEQAKIEFQNYSELPE